MSSFAFSSLTSRNGSKRFSIIFVVGFITSHFSLLRKVTLRQKKKWWTWLGDFCYNKWVENTSNRWSIWIDLCLEFNVTRWCAKCIYTCANWIAFALRWLNIRQRSHIMKRTMQKWKDFSSSGPTILKDINGDGLYYRMGCCPITGATLLLSYQRFSAILKNDIIRHWRMENPRRRKSVCVA